MENNPWACDCRMLWFVEWSRKLNLTPSALHCGSNNPREHARHNNMLLTLRSLNCKPTDFGQLVQRVLLLPERQSIP
uniref:LRRCT domain-containing protein n=2 Tax=Timema TaxID=61471 RepID=A0A7R9FIK9_9NEOP|nr:unnamed protein product [Timema bartmani]CAD7454324.1 unnamed protein product [Timema tahoe]